MKQHLTNRICAAASDRPNRQAFIWDTDITGFGLTITTGGAKTFILQYRIHGRSRRVKLGSFPEWKVKPARERAEKIKAAAREGKDLLKATDTKTVREAYEQYSGPTGKMHSLSDHQQVKAIHYFEAWILPALGTTQLGQVTPVDVETLHKSHSKPYAANRMIDTLKRLFNLAEQWGWFTGRNPCRFIEKNKEHRREAVLNSAQRETLITALTARDQDPDVCDKYLFQLLTGCRPGEAIGAHWDQFSMVEGEVATWTRTSKETKQGTTHTVPLSGKVVAMLQARPRRGDLVFTYEDGRAIERGEKVLKRLLQENGLPPITQYALRHTFVSNGAPKGVDLATMGKLAGHTSIKTTIKYQHFFDAHNNDVMNQLD